MSRLDQLGMAWHGMFKSGRLQCVVICCSVLQFREFLWLVGVDVGVDVGVGVGGERIQGLGLIGLDRGSMSCEGEGRHVECGMWGFRRRSEDGSTAPAAAT